MKRKKRIQRTDKDNEITFKVKRETEVKKTWKARNKKENHTTINITMKKTNNKEDEIEKDIQRAIARWNRSLDGGMSADITIISMEPDNH